MGMISRLLCLFGQHRRSRGRARRVIGGWRSRCRGCAIAMEKLDGGTWHVVPARTAPAIQEP